jgi:arylsulfatase
MKTRTIVLGVLLLIVVAGLLAVVLRPTKNLSVILITVDTLRADHLGAYGYGRQTSPNLDALAKESVLFRNDFSQSSETNPSLGSLLTSYFPHETNVMANRFALPPGVDTLAEILHKHGYQTGAVVSNFTLRRGSGFEQGFDTYDDRTDDWSKTKWEGMERLAPKTTRAAIEWLNGHKGRPLFLWVHYMDPHYPYLPPPPYDTMFDAPSAEETITLPFNTSHTGKGGIHPAAQLGEHHDVPYYVARYDGEIRYLDQSLGDLLQTIRSLGLLETSLIVFGADHGEGLGEHDYYFAHNEFVYRSLIHVPLLVRFPDGRSAGQRVSYPVANVDIMPTILDALSIRYPQTVRGRNLLSSEARDIFAVTLYRGTKMALVTEGVELIDNEGRIELYDFEKDPTESTNLAQDGSGEMFTKVATIRQRVTSISSEDRLSLGAPIEWRIDLEEQRKLKALGYVQ